ncbi:hypothetical protein Syun_030325 [Stephania yunnanensis]|uniref:Calcineurin-like phosphoesterase domain-containing protein n=1 Tax=Stephania yunnanensis TaxID=152371 RepID=A0AAP0HKP4_9MAGN
MEDSNSSSVCRDLPEKLSSFVDAFVDFSVSGLFFPQNPNPNPNPSPQTTIPPPRRLLAVGDLHGDLDKSRQALCLAGLIDSSGSWTGGSATAVQIGDVLDRGGDELRILYYLEKLKLQASASGGSLITMNGNHEVMNAEGDFRYVTRSGLDEFRVWAEWFQIGNSMKSLCLGLQNPNSNLFKGIPTSFPGIKREFHEGIRARIAALRPGGPIATRFLSKNQTVVQIGDSVFVHGGILSDHVVYGLDRINVEVREWMCGLRGGRSPGFARGSDSVVWLRRYSEEKERNCDCLGLEEALRAIPGAKRMVMGHTIQENGINGVCGDRAIRIDVGMSKGCVDGVPEVLEIVEGSGVRVLKKKKNHVSSLKEEERDGGGVGIGFLVPDGGPKQVEVKA